MGLRQERMADEIRDILGKSLMGGKMSDPRLELVTITAVKLTSDLQLASVYFRVMPGSDADEVKKGLICAKGHFRSIVAKHLDTRTAPGLRFFYDVSIEHGSHIEALIDKIHNEK